MRIFVILILVFKILIGYAQPSTPECTLFLKLPHQNDKYYNNIENINKTQYWYIEGSRNNQTNMAVASDYFFCHATPAVAVGKHYNAKKKFNIIEIVKIYKADDSSVHLKFKNTTYFSDNRFREVYFYLIITPSVDFNNMQLSKNRDNYKPNKIMIVKFVLKLSGEIWKYLHQENQNFKSHQITIDYQAGFYELVIKEKMIESTIFDITPKLKKRRMRKKDFL